MCDTIPYNWTVHQSDEHKRSVLGDRPNRKLWFFRKDLKGSKIVDEFLETRKKFYTVLSEKNEEQLYAEMKSANFFLLWIVQPWQGKQDGTKFQFAPRITFYQIKNPKSLLTRLIKWVLITSLKYLLKNKYRITPKMQRHSVLSDLIPMMVFQEAGIYNKISEVSQLDSPLDKRLRIINGKTESARYLMKNIRGTIPKVCENG